MNKFSQLPEKVQGLLSIVVGVAMILYALGIIQKGISLVVILFAAFLILVGYMKIGLHRKIMHLLGRK